MRARGSRPCGPRSRQTPTPSAASRCGPGLKRFRQNPKTAARHESRATATQLLVVAQARRGVAWKCANSRGKPLRSPQACREKGRRLGSLTHPRWTSCSLRGKERGAGSFLSVCFIFTVGLFTPLQTLASERANAFGHVTIHLARGLKVLWGWGSPPPLQPFEVALVLTFYEAALSCILCL